MEQVNKRNPNRHRISIQMHMQILEFYHKDQKSPESIQRFEINTCRLIGLSIRGTEVDFWRSVYFLAFVFVVHGLPYWIHRRGRHARK